MLLDYNVWLILVVINEDSHLLLRTSLTDRVVAAAPANTSLCLSLVIPIVIKVYHGNILLHEGLFGRMVILQQLIIKM